MHLCILDPSMSVLLRDLCLQLFGFQQLKSNLSRQYPMERHKSSHCISKAENLTCCGQGLMDGGLEAAHVLNCWTVCFHRFHVFVQDGKNLIVQNLVLPDPVSHFLKWLEIKTKTENKETWTPSLIIFIAILLSQQDYWINI